ncbi:MAG: FKBP-type peptidyl-prolyl cis-trans isomerase [Gammaproteobacteria bacterium]|nr:FKBP-type peptidyl-prolyl cis-trans isomerase [Gammaproteobacteria bacterium]MBU0849358.1 FKBP-type peptidyl-prolyl cis-trans isomerase [Gammaproteobacteria bacterium]MBU1266509.1 FKBP-type peptidyl-prolyl cis-trans isomerase [Gammaproteobacteria bacterium]MBU1527704.1 FKBP-type peptidyl-prolyl cis-trans isomerase [Gammaproteobacteria bacterium]MBU1779621.1 FKBP-type peptidyl-prolyl cis-trans isomerase [Gammaproteobacteria bacterium]
MKNSMIGSVVSVLSSLWFFPGAVLAEEIKLPSGVVVAIEGKSTGAQKPKSTSTVSVHYEGSLTNGTVFDSSYKRGAPATFPLSGVIPCWTQGVSTMSVGDKATLICPADTAYGARGVPGVIPPNSVLRFKVELLEIKR